MEKQMIIYRCPKCGEMIEAYYDHDPKEYVEYTLCRWCRGL